MPRGGTPPLVPMWPGVRVVERNPYPFFPFNPRWRERLAAADFEVFCVLLKLAWVSPRPCYLSANREALKHLIEPYVRRGHSISDRVLAEFRQHSKTGLLYFPPQLRALQRLVGGEDLYALLWDDKLHH
jgi:hypothetical protein